METRSPSDVAQLPRNKRYFLEKHSCEREKLPRKQLTTRLSLAKKAAIAVPLN
jgi:hypothetical protein